jgi:2-oxoglutarate dehydrogenase E2 component (dihydrolipoamide succinyltransferase)
MAKFEIIMPKLGESIIEATITRWLKQVGDSVSEDDSVVEIATDKVDSEIPSPVDGVIVELLYQEGDIVAVGKPIAVIRIDGEAEQTHDHDKASDAKEDAVIAIEEDSGDPITEPTSTPEAGRFLSPLVRNIAKAEGIPGNELAVIPGTGKEGRLTKRDLLAYLANRSTSPGNAPSTSSKPASPTSQAPAVAAGSGDQVIEMDRMRRLIADHMVMSKQVSPHVTSFIEADMTRIVQWRESQKSAFEKREGNKLTFTHILFEAAARALRDYPGVNASVDGNRIIIRKHIHLGMATMLPNGNLIVPVIRDADQKNIAGMAKSVNDLAARARNNQLQPDEIQGGTFTITNLGSFGSITGTPIINQPQVAILATGAIRKMPAVIETPEGDMIAIRHKIILALTYDHRVVDGGLGGLYLKRLVEYLENFDIHRTA